MTRCNLLLAAWLLAPCAFAAPLSFESYLSAVESHSL